MQEQWGVALGVAVGSGRGEWQWGVAVGSGSGEWQWGVAVGCGSGVWQWGVAVGCAVDLCNAHTNLEGAVVCIIKCMHAVKLNS